MSKKLRELLENLLDFDEIFSKWLSKNLSRLKESSVKLLEHLDPESYKYIRVSTIVSFNFETELNIFKSRTRTIYDGFQIEKRNLIESAITVTSELDVTVDMATLTKIIACARDMPKVNSIRNNRFKDIRLDRWVEEAREKK